MCFVLFSTSLLGLPVNLPRQSQWPPCALCRSSAEPLGLLVAGKAVCPGEAAMEFAFILRSISACSMFFHAEQSKKGVR